MPKFIIQSNRIISIYIHLLILLMKPNSLLEVELQNLDLDSDSSITSQELAHIDNEKLLELAFEKDQALEEEKFNFI